MFKFITEVTHPRETNEINGVHTFLVSQSNHNKKYYALSDKFGSSADIYDTPEEAIDSLIQAQACTRISEIKELKEENGLEEIKETGAFGDLKENTIALNNLKDRIYTDYVSQRISGLNTQVIHIMQNSKDIKSFSHSLSRVLSLANTITTQYDYNEIETQETWVLNKLGSLIKMIAYDIRDLQRQANELI